MTLTANPYIQGINLELGRPQTGAMTMNHVDCRELAGKPSGGYNLSDMAGRYALGANFIPAANPSDPSNSGGYQSVVWNPGNPFGSISSNQFGPNTLMTLLNFLVGGVSQFRFTLTGPNLSPNGGQNSLIKRVRIHTGSFDGSTIIDLPSTSAVSFISGTNSGGGGATFAEWTWTGMGMILPSYYGQTLFANIFQAY